MANTFMQKKARIRLLPNPARPENTLEKYPAVTVPYFGTKALFDNSLKRVIMWNPQPLDGPVMMDHGLDARTGEIDG